MSKSPHGQSTHHCFGQVSPLFGRGQLVGLHVALVGHDAIARQGLAEVETLWVIHWVAVDLGGHRRVANLGYLLQQLIACHDLECHHIGGPEHVGSLPHWRLAHIVDAGGAALVQNLQFDARAFGFKGFLVGIGQFLGKGRNDVDRVNLCQRG